MMSSILFLGILIGMRHAFEADHVAAVASLVSSNQSLRDSIKQGAIWGLGHTLTLFIFGSIVILMDTSMPERIALGLEFIVGIMLIVLGIDVIRRLMKNKVHFHSHKHESGEEHFHAHSHKGEIKHNSNEHRHEHNRSFPLRALLVGLMHGMAGSAALILLVLQTVKSPLTGLLYMLLFGVGSLIGMAVLSAIIAIPLQYSSRGLTWLHHGFHIVIGFTTIILGSTLTYESRIFFL
tara:strand:+ start:2166 stop:2873 length:708 start_codon:yes stop_codon:yes gene_type:complete